MILVTVGMQLGFDRLISAMDQLAPGLEMPVIAQTGQGTYTPRNMEARAKIAPAEFEQLVQQCCVIVSHAGIGTVLTAARFVRPIILVPRRASLHEHRNDHQLATGTNSKAGRAFWSPMTRPNCPSASRTPWQCRTGRRRNRPRRSNCTTP